MNNWTNELVGEYAALFLQEMLKNISAIESKEKFNAFTKPQEFLESKKTKQGWKIISFKNINTGIVDIIENRPLNADWWLKDKSYTIQSVRRLSDNEVFSIGDKVRYNGTPCKYDYFTIHNFFITRENRILVRSGLSDCAICELLEHCEKVKPKVPLFTTIDGSDFYKDDCRVVYCLHPNFKYYTGKAEFCDPKSDVKYFLHEDNCKSYILEHKPIQVSYKEIYDYIESYDNDCSKENYTSKWDRMKDFFKSKINP